MGYADLGLTGGTHRANLCSAFGAFSVAGATQSKQVKPATNVSVPLLQAKSLTDRYGPSETWVPYGIAAVVSANFTVTIPVLTLQKNGVAAATGGLASFGALLTASVNEVFIPFTPWTFSAPDLAGDAWSVLVTTAATLGTLNELWLVYGLRMVAGVGTGVTL